MLLSEVQQYHLEHHVNHAEHAQHACDENTGYYSQCGHAKLLEVHIILNHLQPARNDR